MAAEMAAVVFFDRSRRALDWKCRQARWWGFEYRGRGLSPRLRPDYFDIGTAIHDILAAALQGEGIDRALGPHLLTLRQQLALATPDRERVEERVTLVEGLARGWYRWGRQRLLDEYEVVAVEREVTYRWEGVTMACRPDLILRRRSDGTYWYLEWKTTGMLGEKWFAQWNYAIQLLTGCLAVEQTLGLPMEGAVVQGLYKGYEREGKLTSIFCHGYTTPARYLLPGETVRPTYKWVNGARRLPVWEMPGGVAAWVAGMPDEVLQDQFAQSPPITLDSRRTVIEAYLRQAARREKEIHWAAARANASDAAGWDLEEPTREAFFDTYFPQAFDQCAPAVGAPCPFRDLCYNPVMAEDPLRTGLYQWREPHHAGDPAGEVEG